MMTLYGFAQETVICASTKRVSFISKYVCTKSKITG